MRFKLSFVLVAIAGTLVVGGLVLRATAPSPELLPAAGLQPVAIETARLRAAEDLTRVEVAGLLEARRLVELYAEGAGRVLETGAEQLDRVAAGQMLVRIDPIDADVAVLRAEAALARAESELSLARATLRRRRQLAGSAVASEQALEEAENGERVALAALRETQAVLRDARDQREKRTVRAAFDGVLRVFSVEAGEYVNVGQKIGELLDTSSVRITAGLSDREVVDVRTDEPVRVLVEARPGEVFEGRVARVAKASDLTSRKFPVQIEVSNESGRLFPGMIARVMLRLGDGKPQLRVPRDAVLEQYGLRYAFAVEGDEEGNWVVRRRPLEVREISFEPSELEIVSGLSDGDEIALTSLFELRDGVPVSRRARSAAKAAEQGP